MHNKLPQLPMYFALVVLLAATILTAYSSGSAGQPPASTTPATSTPAQTAAPARQPDDATGQQEGQDMQALQKKLLARVAEILGVSSDSLTTAYEAAIKSVMGDKAPSGSGSQGMPPQPPADNRTGGTGGPGGQGKDGPDMTGVYSKVAEALGLTTEKVQAAFEQAQKELMPARTK